MEKTKEKNNLDKDLLMQHHKTRKLKPEYKFHKDYTLKNVYLLKYKYAKNRDIKKLFENPITDIFNNKKNREYEAKMNKERIVNSQRMSNRKKMELRSQSEGIKNNKGIKMVKPPCFFNIHVNNLLSSEKESDLTDLQGNQLLNSQNSLRYRSTKKENTKEKIFNTTDKPSINKKKKILRKKL